VDDNSKGLKRYKNYKAKKDKHLKDRNWSNRQLWVSRLGKSKERKTHIKRAMFGSRGYHSGTRQ